MRAALAFIPKMEPTVSGGWSLDCKDVLGVGLGFYSGGSNELSAVKSSGTLGPIVEVI